MSVPDQSVLEALAAELGRLLCDSGLCVSTAESCTGGWVAQCLTAVPGSSEWFDRGFVTYSNAAKEEMLGVPALTLAVHGAVCEPVAAAMAAGAIARGRADWSLAITGVAGPGGGSEEKPVGMVCFGWVARGGPVEVTTRLFSGSRRDVRAQSVGFALQGLIDRLSTGIA